MPRSARTCRSGPIDARGLVAQAPLGDATKGSPGGIGMYSGASALAVTTNFQQSQDTLYALAADTGGKALLDYNDLAKGIVQAQQAISSYYIIGYYTTNTRSDGKFRRIKITLNESLSAKLDYRQGYFAGKEFAKFTAADKERQLEDALMLRDPDHRTHDRHGGGLLPAEPRRILRARSPSRFPAANWRWPSAAAPSARSSISSAK